ncbi:hypothetical protein AB0I72_00665 [Nocardiopsis sp. NPDC049922]|uniref:hypothetical protein n=1 Tax=Nocardiopsis sp. NPDC049922 TaxID=3155157 RepID=UPI0033CDEECA
MPLHPYAMAQGRATIFDPTEPLLSVTLDTMPHRVPFVIEEILPGHFLIHVRDSITYGALVRAYIDGLPDWARRRLFHATGIVDFRDNPDLCERMMWWNPDWPVNPTSVRMIEESFPGLVTPWNHAWLATVPA